MDCRRRTRPIGLRWWRTWLSCGLLSIFLSDFFDLRSLLPNLLIGGALSSLLLDAFCGCLFLYRLLPRFFCSSLPLRLIPLGSVRGSLLPRYILPGLFCSHLLLCCLFLRSLLLRFFQGYLLLCR